MLSNANAKKPEEPKKKELLARSFKAEKSLLELPRPTGHRYKSAALT